MKWTIQELREERGESRSDLAEALGVNLSEVTEWEMGRREPTISRLRVLTEHFGVRDDQLNLRPGDPPSLGERLMALLYGEHSDALADQTRMNEGREHSWPIREQHQRGKPHASRGYPMQAVAPGLPIGRVLWSWALRCDPWTE